MKYMMLVYAAEGAWTEEELPEAREESRTALAMNLRSRAGTWARRRCTLCQRPPACRFVGATV